MKKTPNRVVIINAISAGLLNGISMIMMPVYSYLLGTEVYGLSSVYTTWVTILSIVIGLQVFSSIGVAQKDFPASEQLTFQANGVYAGFGGPFVDGNAAVSACVWNLLCGTAEQQIHL